MFKIFIGRIHPETSQTELEALFGQVALVHRVEFVEFSEFPLQYLEETRDEVEPFSPSKKFGFVEIASETEARAVVNAFNGIELPGTSISGLMLFGPHGAGDEP